MKDASDDLTQFQNLSLGPTTSASGELGLAKNSSIEDTTNLGQILDSQMMNTVNGDQLFQNEKDMPNFPGGLTMAASQSVMKLEKLSNEDWESPKRSHKFSKRKENEDSGDDSEKHSSSEDLDQLTDLIESPDQVIKSKASTD